MIVTQNLKEKSAEYSNLVIAGYCVLELFNVLPPFAGALLGMQMLVVHSFPFMFFMVGAIKDPVWKKRAFWGLLAVYTIGAFDMEGVFGIAQFYGLTFTTYYSYILKESEQGGKAELVARWVVSTALLLVLAIAAGFPKEVKYWNGCRYSAVAGIIYYTALWWLEHRGLYREMTRRFRMPD